MKVRDVMTSDVGYCQLNTTLANAAMIMWQRDCGVVPIVNEQKRVVGMITDRDICIALAMQNRLATEIQVSKITSDKVKSCRPDDDLENVLKTMKRRQLRRLPVTNKDGVLVGIISISDVLHAAKGKEIKKRLFAALRQISSLRPVHLHEIADDSEDHIHSEDDSDDSIDRENINTRKEAKEIKQQSEIENEAQQALTEESEDAQKTPKNDAAGEQ